LSRKRVHDDLVRADCEATSAQGLNVSSRGLRTGPFDPYA
jgi:hypothetical protein